MFMLNSICRLLMYVQLGLIMQIGHLAAGTTYDFSSYADGDL